MANLSEVSIDKIETDTMSVLYANIDKVFTQFTLFNKLLIDKYDNPNSIHPNFKSKYLLVLRTLMSKYDDILVEKNEQVYTVVCKSNNSENNNSENYDNWFNEQISNPISLDNSDYNNMYDYIYDNNLNEHMTWNDPFNGNSIYHELILNNNIKQISKLIEEDNFNYELKNKNNKTPIDLINSTEMSNLIISKFVKDMILLKEKYNKEKSNVESLVNDFNKKIDFYESNEYVNQIIQKTTYNDFIMEKTRKYHFTLKMYFISIFVCYLAIKFIF